MRTVCWGLAVILATFSPVLSGWANENASQFVKVFGDTIEDDAEDVIRVVENNVPYYVTTGWTHKTGGLRADLVVAKFDTLGELVWRTVIGDTATPTQSNGTIGRTLIESEDHKYLVGGATEACGQGGGDIILVKVDTDGDVIWAKTYGGSSKEDCECITSIGKNQYLLVGFTASHGAGDADFLVIEIDSLGNPLSNKVITLGTAYRDEGWRVIKTADAFVMVGFTKRYEETLGQEAVIVKYNHDLDQSIWAKHIGVPNSNLSHEGFVSVVEAPDETTYVVTGGIHPGYYGGTQDALFCRIDSDDGHLIWTKAFGTSGWDFFPTMVRAADDSMLVGGWVGTSPYTQHDALIAKFDPATGGFGLRWAVGDTVIDDNNEGNDFGRSAIETDKGYLLAGRSWSWGQGKTDLLVAKFDSAGVTCQGHLVSPSVHDFDWTASNINMTRNVWSTLHVDSLGEGIVLNPRSWVEDERCTGP